jgi:hypothetical protein
MAANNQNRSEPQSRSARERAIEAYDGARDRVAGAGQKAGDALTQAPLIALAGGLAAGALIAALLPKTRREEELLRPVGKRLTGTARAAADAAREAGTQRLEELGLTRDAGIDTIRSILKGAGEAAKTSAQAAVGTVRGKDRE